MISWKAAVGNRAWRLACVPESMTFHREAPYFEAVQRRKLKHYLKLYAGTPWGAERSLHKGWCYHRFSQETPLHTYEEILPHFQEASSSIIPHPVKTWEPTGGSTGGNKWLPWTSALQEEFRAAVSVWIGDLFHQIPSLKNGRSYWQITPATEPVKPVWLQSQRVGFENDGDYLGSVGRLLEEAVLVSVDKGTPKFWERTVETLLDTRDLRLISCWSPSFLQVLKEKFLERAGCWEPEVWWPSLKVVSCWTQGPSRLMESETKTLFRSATIQGKGLLSTEAVTTIPIGKQYPLAFRSHFFEFVGEDGTVHPSWSIEPGEVYEVVQTTSGGLVRYRSGDKVRMTGRWRGVPCLEFLGRVSVCDHFGEKLSHSFLLSVLEEAPCYARLVFEEDRYCLVLADVNQEEARCFQAAVDSRLREVYTYGDCLRLGQLRPLGCFLAEVNSQTLEDRILGSQRALTKPSPLLPVGEWLHSDLGHFLEEGTGAGPGAPQ